MDAQKFKKRAEDVLTFGYPSDRFDVQRMPGEQGRHHCARPDRPRNSPKKQKEEDSIGNVEQEIEQVVTDRIQAEHLNVNCVRQPGHEQSGGGYIAICIAAD